MYSKINRNTELMFIHDFISDAGMFLRRVKWTGHAARRGEVNTNFE
jgi:hypothetical protein